VIAKAIIRQGELFTKHGDDDGWWKEEQHPHDRHSTDQPCAQADQKMNEGFSDGAKPRETETNAEEHDGCHD
jgi:hypothetical protein